jgi:DNA-binding LacI/PurR family transcriptional regulator
VARHLLDLGHRRIAVAWNFGLEVGPAAPATALIKDLIEFAGGRCFAHDLADEPSLIRMVREEGVTAYWALNDYAALRCETVLLRDGLRVPRDVSVVGRNDTPWARSAPTPLTSLSIEPEATARAMVSLLLRMARGEPVPDHTPVKPRIIVRDSTTPARPDAPGTDPS